MALVVLIGAPGVGKTTIAAAVVEDEPEVQVAHFDRIGAPSTQEIERDHGSVEGWRRSATAEWMRRLAPAVARDEPVILEGRMEPAVVEEAAQEVGVRCVVVLIDCDDEERATRLAADGRSADDDQVAMTAWAATLRDDAAERGLRVIDTTMRGVASCADEVIRLVRR